MDEANEMMLGYELLGKSENTRGSDFSRSACWEFTGFPCEKCMEQVVVLGNRAIGYRGTCMLCAETMKSSLLTMDEQALVNDFAIDGVRRQGDLAVSRICFDGVTAEKAAGWLSRHGVEADLEKKAWGRQAVLGSNFDQMSLKVAKCENGVFVLIGKTYDEAEEEKSSGGKDMDLQKSGEFMGYTI